MLCCYPQVRILEYLHYLTTFNDVEVNDFLHTRFLHMFEKCYAYKRSVKSGACGYYYIAYVIKKYFNGMCCYLYSRDSIRAKLLTLLK